MKVAVLFAVLVGLAVAEENQVSINAPMGDGDAVHVGGKVPPGANGRHKRAACGVTSTLTAAQQTESVRIHNYWRAKEPASNMISLAWNAPLSTVAQAYANQCIWAHGMLYDCNNNRVGQNLALTCNAAGYPAFNVTDLVTQWNNERNYYNMATGTCASGQECGHWTQNVNARSSLVGCGVAQCPKVTVGSAVWTNCVLLVCDYLPPGNVAGQPIYLSGTACSNCDSDNTGAGYKCSSGICTPCTPASDPACKCGTPQTCQNGGVWDGTQCACNCGGTYYGLQCENQCTCGDATGVDCVDLAAYCTQADYAQYMSSNCKKTCGFACNLPSSCTTIS